MAKTLAEMRAEASGPPPRPKATRTVTLIEGQHLLDESRRLNEELVDVLAQAQRDRMTEADDDSKARARKVGQAPDPDPEPPARALEIKAEQAKMVDQLTEYQAELGLIGISGGEWQLFKEANPARADSQVDLKLAGGHCNADALFAILGRFVATWDGDQLADGDWDNWLAERICYADRRDLIPAVVEMYEEAIFRAPKSRSSSPEIRSSETG